MSRKKIAIALNLDWPLKRYHDFYKGIQHYANKYTDWIVTSDHYPENRLKQSKIDNPFYDGIIGRIKHDCYEEANRFNIPMVNTWLASDLYNKIPSVYPDHKKNGEVAAEQLLKRGFRNFVSIDFTSEDRSSTYFTEGIEKALQGKNCKLEKRSVVRNFSDSAELWLNLQNSFEEWSKNWEFPIALLMWSTALAPRISSFCLEHGYKIPEQIAIMTCGNEIIHCECEYPHISTVEIDFFTQGIKSAKMLHDQLLGAPLQEETILIPPGEVISRESTDTFAVKDENVKIALRYIADNIDNNLQIHNIIDQVKICRRSLEVNFKKELGRSILEEINFTRVEMAKKLLKESNENIKTIRKLSGFTSSLQMRRLFNKQTGCTPGEYRNQAANS